MFQPHDAVFERREHAEEQRRQRGAHDHHLGARQRDDAHERVADVEVAVKGDGDHDEGGEGRVGGGEQEVELAHAVVVGDEAPVLHVGGERHEEDRGEQVDDG